MKHVKEQALLVVAGAWNPAIVNPSWIGQHVFEYDPNYVFPVNVELRAQNSEVASPVYSFDGLRLTCSRERLTFFLKPDIPSDIPKAFNTAAKIIRLLPHTPLTAFGVNFQFIAETPSEELLSTFTNSSLVSSLNVEGASCVQEVWRLTFQLTDRQVNLHAKREGGAVVLSVNNHFEISAPGAAANTLEQAGIYNSLFEASSKMVCSVAQEDLDG